MHMHVCTCAHATMNAWQSTAHGHAQHISSHLSPGDDSTDVAVPQECVCHHDPGQAMCCTQLHRRGQQTMQGCSSTRMLASITYRLGLTAVRSLPPSRYAGSPNCASRHSHIIRGLTKREWGGDWHLACWELKLACVDLWGIREVGHVSALYDGCVN